MNAITNEHPRNVLTPDMKEEARQRIEMRLDGMMNVLTGFGSAGNTYHGAHPLAAAFLTDFEQLNTLYDTNGIAQTIVDRPAEDATAKWFELSNDPEDFIKNEMDRLGVREKATDALRWSRLQGGAAWVLICRDGRGLSQSLYTPNLDEVVEIRVYKMQQISVWNGQYYTDPNSEKYGRPRVYQIKPERGNAFPVHESRVIPFPGNPRAGRTDIGRNDIPWYGNSVLRAVLSDVDRLYKGYFWALRLLERKQAPIYKMAGMADTLANMPEGEGEDLIKRRLKMVDYSRNALNTTTVDVEDEYTVENLGVDGVSDIIGEFKTALAAAGRMPGSILYGTSPNGLNATGEGELAAYDASVEQTQNTKLRPALERLISLLYAQRVKPVQEPDSWQIKFNPIRSTTPQQKSEADKGDAEARSAFVDSVMKMKTDGLIDAPSALAVIRTRYPDYRLPEEVPAGAYDAAREKAQAEVKAASRPPAPSPSPRPPGAPS